MPMLHETDTRSRVITRIRDIRADNTRRWGKMSVDQMLWHVNQGLLSALGQLELEPQRVPLPRPVFKALALNLPWPKGAPTAPAYVARESYDLEQQRQRCVEMINALAGRDLGAAWAPHAAFGHMSGRDWSRLMYKHLDHHLRQFSG